MRPCALVLAAGLGLAAVTAHANGRFPQANLLTVGPADRNEVLVLRTTFGVVLSRDLGAHWEWVCEEALDAVGTFDPSVALAASGAITLGLPMGMRVSSADGCTWTSPAGGLPAVVDLTQNAAGNALFAVGSFYDEARPYTVVARSDDGGASWQRRARVDGFIAETIDVAPSSAQRVYVTGYRPGAIPTLLRSDDGGGSFRVTTAAFPTLASVWIAAVDPVRPDRLWFRVAAGLGTQLYRSEDGGGSVTLLAETREPMDGFAVSDDGETVWYGTANRAAGIFRAVRGAPFTRVAASASVRCMRFHDGVLFVCGDEAVDGYSLAWSRDGGESLRPLMSVRDIQGPLARCGDGGITATCASPWELLRGQLRDLDAAVSPPRDPLPPRDAGPDALDAPATDALDAPVTDAPATDAPATDAPATDAPATDAPATDAVIFTPDLATRDVVLDAGIVAPDRPPPRDAAPPRDTATPRDCDCRARPGTPVSHPGWMLAMISALRLRARRRARAR